MLHLLHLMARAPVFRKLSEPQLKQLAELAVRRNLAKGDLISFYGDHFPYVILIHDGMVNINKESSEGRSLAMRSCPPGSVIWGHALFDGQPTLGTLRAFEVSSVYQWHSNDILPILQQNAEALWELCQVLHEQIRFASLTIEKLAFIPLVNRLAQLLLDQFQSAHLSPIDRTMTLDEMAAKIGTTREVVCRLLHKFSDRNVIEVSRSQFVLVNKIELEKIASGDLVS